MARDKNGLPLTISEKMGITRANLGQLLDLMDIIHHMRLGPVTLATFNRIHMVKERPGQIDLWCNTRIMVTRLARWARKRLGIVVVTGNIGAEGQWQIIVSRPGKAELLLEALLDDLAPLEWQDQLSERRA